MRAKLFLLYILILFSGCKAEPQTTSLELLETIPLPDLNGRIDHLSFVKEKNIVFVAALGNNSVEAVNLKTKALIHSLKNMHEPQGVVFIPEINSVFVANGDNGECNVFNTETFQKTNTIKLEDDADNVRYNAAEKKIYVGYGSGGIAIIDATNFTLVNTLKLPAHPESFQFDKTNHKMYVNIPNEKQIDVIDLLQNKIIGEWKLNEASSNFPMALDELNHRLFIGCRHPSRLLVLDTENGKTISSLDIDDDTDDIFYNSTKKEIYVSCGSGYVDVIRQADTNHYSSNGKIKTKSGARTSLLIPELHQLVVAAPARNGNDAQLIILKIN